MPRGREKRKLVKELLWKHFDVAILVETEREKYFCQFVRVIGTTDVGSEGLESDGGILVLWDG